MIKQIFVPEKVNSYYLFSKRIVGIEITKTHVYAVKIRLSGKTITIEKVVQEKIVQKEASQDAIGDEAGIDPIAQSLSTVIASMIPFDEVRSAIPSSAVVFKELKLPFLDREKIKMVIGHEVEPLLPFPIHKAVTDFIITRCIKEEKSSDVMTATVQKSYLEAHLNQFHAAGIPVDLVTVDMFALYNLWRKIPTNQSLTGKVVVIDIGFELTRILYIENQQLRSVRNFLQGVLTVAKKAAGKNDVMAFDLLEIMMRSGLDRVSDEYQQEVRNASQAYWKMIGLTISSFVKDRDVSAVEQLFIMGEGALIHGLSETIAVQFGIPCSLLDASLIAQIPELALLNRSAITPALVTSLAIAIPEGVIEDFTLRQEEFHVVSERLFVKQILSVFSLTGLFLGLLGTVYFMRVQSLENELADSSKELIQVLKKQFPRLSKVDEPADEMVELAKKEVEKEQETWFAFSLSLQSRFLQYLLELTNKIDKESLDFVVERITIAENIITLKAQVKNYEALKILERELRQSPLFMSVEPQDNPRFTMKITLAQIKE